MNLVFEESTELHDKFQSYPYISNVTHTWILCWS